MAVKLLRDRVALGIAVVALAAGLLPMAILRYDAGIKLGLDSTAEHLVIQDVDPLGPAAQDGVRSGMIVVAINGATLIYFPQPVYGSPSPDGAQPIVGAEPAAPRSRAGAEALTSLLNTPIEQIEVIEPWDLSKGSVDNGYAVGG